MFRRSISWVILAIALMGWCCVPGTTRAAVGPRAPLETGELELALAKLRVLGSVLYLGAHPDDENTAVIAYFSKGRHLRTGYLSLTRGDGGQNLIGNEIGTELGVIRTQELLAARQIDGGEQFFSRALDFGYSKSTEESLEKWGREAILGDVVWVIRKFRPDIVVTRFTPENGGHGHHTASAVLAAEAFDAAADPKRFPEQLKLVKPWQVKRLFWNAWSLDAAGEDAHPLGLETGRYDPLLGRAYTEIAAEARSQHKTQGFGSSGFRGAVTEYLVLTKGEPAESDPFEGVDLGRSRIPGGERVDALLAKAEDDFVAEHPDAILPELIEAYGVLETLGDDPWIAVKKKDLLGVIRSCAGLWIEAIAETHTAHPGDTLRVNTLIVNRSEQPMTLERVEMPYGGDVKVAARQPAWRGQGSENADAGAELVDRALPANVPVVGEVTLSLPADVATTQPFWLARPPVHDRFDFDDLAHLGVAENPPAITARFILRAADRRLAFEVPVVYRWTDPVKGERYRPLEIVPAFTASFVQSVYLFPGVEDREVRVVVRGDHAGSGTVRLELPRGWSVTPKSAGFELAEGAEQTSVGFMVGAPAGRARMEHDRMRAVVYAEGRSFTTSLTRIDYDHIPVQTLMPPAEATLVRADVEIHGKRVGYVMGPGDEVPSALREMGYQVTLLSDDDLQQLDLSGYDAIVTGVRAYNTRDRLAALQPRLLAYVERGGVLVVQYNTATRGFDVPLGPYPFTVSRNRVTVEEAEVRFLVPDHPLLNVPNKITAADFEGWVQERGTYFAKPWDERYQTVLSSNDPGEDPLDGGLLYAPYGKGVFIYVGYVMFRELPAGIPGAYRLFANLVSGGR